MEKKFLSVAIIFLGVGIIVGCLFISQALKSDQANITEENQYRYEFISANDSNIIIFDKQTGEYWRKYIEPNEGPTNWEKQTSPFSTSLE